MIEDEITNSEVPTSEVTASETTKSEMTVGEVTTGEITDETGESETGERDRGELDERAQERQEVWGVDEVRQLREPQAKVAAYISHYLCRVTFRVIRFIQPRPATKYCSIQSAKFRFIHLPIISHYPHSFNSISKSADLPHGAAENGKL